MPETITPIYSGRLEGFHYASFGSGGGTNLAACAEIIKPSLIFSDRPRAKLIGLERLAGVPQIIRSGFEACGSWKQAKGNTVAEAEYEKRSVEFNKQILEDLRSFEAEHSIKIDLIVLGGYMRLITEPLLSAYEDRIINVHPSAVPVSLNPTERLYIGDSAVYDSLQNRQQSTRSSVLLVDNQVDHGEVLVQGPELAVWHEFLRGTDAERRECARELADAHQSMQKVRSDWPALTTALKMISQGRIALGTEKVHYDEWRQVYIDGKPMPPEGFQLAA